MLIITMSDLTMPEIAQNETPACAAARQPVIGPVLLGIIVGITFTGLIVAMSITSGIAYHLAVYGEVGSVLAFVSVGCIVALAYLLPQIYRNEIRIEAWLGRRRRNSKRHFNYNLGRVSALWAGAFAIMFMMAFLTKTTELYSRGWVVLFFVGGFNLILGFEAALVPILQRLRRTGWITPRRLFLIGSIEQIAAYRGLHNQDDGYAIVSELVIEPGTVAASEIAMCSVCHDGMYEGMAEGVSDEALEQDELDRRSVIREGVGAARRLNVDDVLILADWSQRRLISDILNGFSMMPAAIHIRADAVLTATGRLRSVRYGPQAALGLVARPLSPIQCALKRFLDLAVAIPALIILSPLLMIVAALIKLDSQGPVLFRQHRRGYNHREFRIYKFRTMMVMDDGDVVIQAQRNDPRITRMGRFLRKSNIDELPQLLNVLMGDMSVVGPRPHALAHDRFFEQRIGTYGRRLNVRPGITGWAQVNGWRGETETDEKMQRRVDCDLAYIDNWSLAFDLYILMQTVLSPKCYRNAR